MKTLKSIRLVSVKTASKYLGVTPRTILRLCSLDLIHYKIGNNIYKFDIKDLQSYKKKRET